jgi:hypothetical protein
MKMTLPDEHELIRRELVYMIQLRYELDGKPLSLQDAEDLLGRLDQEVDYLGGYIRD